MATMKTIYLIDPKDPDAREKEKRLSIEDRFLAGFQLFEIAVAKLRDDVRMENPRASNQEVESIVSQIIDAERDDKERYRP